MLYSPSMAMNGLQSAEIETYVNILAWPCQAALTSLALYDDAQITTNPHAATMFLKGRVMR